MIYLDNYSVCHIVNRNLADISKWQPPWCFGGRAQNY